LEAAKQAEVFDGGATVADMMTHNGWADKVLTIAIRAYLEATTPTDQAGIEAVRHKCAKSGLHDHDGCSCSDEELARRLHEIHETIGVTPELRAAKEAYDMATNHAQDHIPDAGEMVPTDQAELEVVAWLKSQATEAEADDMHATAAMLDLAIASISQASTLLAAKDARIAELTLERDKADNVLVDKYRDPKTGHFSFPGDVAAIVRRLEASEASLANAVEVLTKIACLTQTEGLLWWQIEARAFLSEQKP
jgi:hypothetical protein